MRSVNHSDLPDIFRKSRNVGDDSVPTTWAKRRILIDRDNLTVGYIWFEGFNVFEMSQ